MRLRQPIAAPKKERGRTQRRMPAAAESWEGVDRSLFDALRTWRRAEAEERGVPPYVIFSDRTLREVARSRPATLHDLRDVYGVGNAKLESFGRAVLDIVSSRARA